MALHQILILTLCSAAAFVSPTAAQSANVQTGTQEPNGYTWGELALLPEYCRDAQGILYEGLGSNNMSPRAPHWLALLGDDYWHIHHYCHGMRNLMRIDSGAVEPMHRGSLLERTIGEFNYIVRNSKPSMPLMPEVFYRMGEVHLRLNQVAQALACFERSRQLKPDYWPSYVRWIDVLLQSRQFEAAEALAKEGLEHVPGQPELLKRLKASQTKSVAGAKVATERK